MNPLGHRIAIIRKGTRVIESESGNSFIMPESIRVFLLAARNNHWSFIYIDRVYLIHDDQL